MDPTTYNISRLCDLLNRWQTRENLPHICAFEQLFEDISDAQRDWLERFNAAWDRWAR